MSYVVHAFQTRKAGLTPAEFKHHYDSVHIPLLLELAGEDFPLEHRRHFLEHSSPDKADITPIIFTGGDGAAAFYQQFDVDAELIFKDEAHFHRFAAKMFDETNAKRMMEDQVKFQDFTKVWSAKFELPSVTKRT